METRCVRCKNIYKLKNGDEQECPFCDNVFKFSDFKFHEEYDLARITESEYNLALNIEKKISRISFKDENKISVTFNGIDEENYLDDYKKRSIVTAFYYFLGNGRKTNETVNRVCYIDKKPIYNSPWTLTFAVYLIYLRHIGTDIDDLRQKYKIKKYELEKAKQQFELPFTIDEDLYINTGILNKIEHTLDNNLVDITKAKFDINSKKEEFIFFYFEKFNLDTVLIDEVYRSKLINENIINEINEKYIFIKQIIIVEYLRRKGLYQDFYNKCLQKELDEEKLLKNKDKYTNTDNLNNLLNNIECEYNEAIYSCVASDDIEERSKIIDIITSKIFQVKKVKKIEKYSIEELAVKLTSVNKDDLFNYNNLDTDIIYIIDELDEYFDDYNNNNMRLYMKKACSYLIKLLGRYKENQYIIITGTINEINKFLAINKNIEFLFSNNTIEIKDKTFDELYDIYVNNLSDDIKVKLNNNNTFKDIFLNYYTLNKSYIPFKNIELAIYLANYSNSNKDLVFPPSLYKEAKLDLDKIIGMGDIKKKIIEFENYVQFMQKTKALGIKLPNSNMHMLFSGPAGTGKTTIARIIANILYQIGLLKENKMIEVSRADLIGQYLGQTAPKTQEVIDKAMGGILFIDEAYSLYLRDDDMYGSECIATLIKNMEDKKGEFIVIFAGYEKEMQDFMDANSGIRSRIGYTFNFTNYTESELFDILKVKVKNMGFTLKKDAEQQILKIIKYFISMKDFGNGRFVDKILQQILIKHSQFDNNIKLISANSIPEISEIIKTMPSSFSFNTNDMSEEIINRVAYHELGHAIVRKILTNKHNITEISIEPDNGSYGKVIHAIASDAFLPTEDFWYNELASIFAGMVAEKIFLGSHSGGCSDDYRKIKEITNTMVDTYCMKNFDWTDEQNKAEIMKKARKIAEDVIVNNKEVIKYVKDYLIEHKTITGEKLDELIEEYNEDVTRNLF